MLHIAEELQSEKQMALNVVLYSEKNHEHDKDHKKY